MNCLHMSGAGNDFMVMDARGKETELDFAKMAVQLCAKTGVLTEKTSANIAKTKREK